MALPSPGPTPWQGVQVLTRGPVHEAFAGMVTYNPEPGIVVTKAPPAAIEEIPPGTPGRQQRHLDSRLLGVG